MRAQGRHIRPFQRTAFRVSLLPSCEHLCLTCIWFNCAKFEPAHKSEGYFSNTWWYLYLDTGCLALLIRSGAVLNKVSKTTHSSRRLSKSLFPSTHSHKDVLWPGRSAVYWPLTSPKWAAWLKIEKEFWEWSLVVQSSLCGKKLACKVFATWDFVFLFHN